MCNINIFLTQNMKNKALVTIPMVPIFVNVLISRMFQYLATFCKEVCPSPLRPWHLFRCWYVHLACLVPLGNMLVLVDFCISTMGGWHCCCVDAWTSCDCGVSCNVGVTSCGNQLSYSSQVVPEMPLHRFHGRFKCVVV
jgi:hypothetical protein